MKLHFIYYNSFRCKNNCYISKKNFLIFNFKTNKRLQDTQYIILLKKFAIIMVHLGYASDFCMHYDMNFLFEESDARAQFCFHLKKLPQKGTWFDLVRCNIIDEGFHF